MSQLRAYRIVLKSNATKVFLAALIGGLGVYGFMRETKGPTSRAPGVDHADLLNRVTQLEAAVERLSARPPVVISPGVQANQLNAQEAASPPLPAGPGEEKSSPEERRSVAEQANRELVQSIEAQFEAQTRGGAWSVSTERNITEVFRNPELAGVRLVSAKCGATICRMSLAFESIEDRPNFERQWNHLNPVPNGESVATHFVGDDGRPASTLYIAQAGHRLAREAENR